MSLELRRTVSKTPNLECPMSTYGQSNLQFCLNPVLYLLCNKRASGDGDPVHSTSLLIHQQPDNQRGLWGKEPTRRYQTRAQPWKLRAAMSASHCFPHHQSFSNTMVSLPPPVIPRITGRFPTSCWQNQQMPKSRTPPPNLTPCVSSNTVISLYLAQNKRTPSIPADRRGAGCRCRPQSKPNPFTVRTLSVQPTYRRVWCMCLHTREHDALLQPALPTALHRRAAPSVRRTEEAPSY